MIPSATRFERLAAPVFALVAASLIAACQPGGDTEAGVPGDTSDMSPFSRIAPDDALRVTGTEPFWSAEIVGNELVYATPENIDGTTLAVTRFAGRGGLSFSGELAGAAFDLTVTEGECSDGMSDRSYPFTATLKIGGEVRNGCAYSEAFPFEGPENP